MTKDEDFKLLKIQTCILKVNIHCDGCKQKVKKLLQRIEGVYSVIIDAEHQKVTVSGNVDSATLIKRLARSGKHAELWSQKSINQNIRPNNQHKQQQQQQQVAHLMKDGSRTNKDHGKQGLTQGLKTFRNQHNNKLPSFSSDDDDEDCDDDDEDFDDDDLRFLTDKMNQINLLRQTGNATAAANAKKNGNNGSAAAAKKSGGNPNQTHVVVKNPNGSEPKAPNFAAIGKMGNVAPNAGEGKRVSDINGMMGGLGLHGFGGSSGMPGSSFPGYTGFNPSNGVGFGGAGQQQQAPMMMNMQGNQGHPSSVMMNMQGNQGHPSSVMMNLQRGQGNNMMMHDSSRYMQQQQPQMMYHRAPQITPPFTGYYHQYYPTPYLNTQAESPGDFGAHLFSDENSNGCVVM